MVIRSVKMTSAGGAVAGSAGAECQETTPTEAALSCVVVGNGDKDSSPTESLSKAKLSLSASADLSKAFDWILQKEGYSRTDYRGLAKRLPAELQQALQDGEISPEDIICSLSKSYKPKIAIRSTGETDLDPLQFLATRLVELALQSPTNTASTVDESFRRELVADVQKTFDRVTADQIQVYVSAEGTPDAQRAVFPLWKQALDETLERWSDRLDAAFYPNKPPGTFAQLCPVFKISQAKFQRKLQTVLRDVDGAALHRDYHRASQKEAHLLEAVHSIQAGLHTVKKQCWQCAKTLQQQELLACGACNTASYCGKACQKTAWKTGHKHACASLKCAQAQSVLDLNTVQQLHRQNTTTHRPGEETAVTLAKLPGTNLFLADIVDYKLLPLLVRVSAVLTNKNLSMEHYYSNLKRVATHTFWLFPSSSTVEDQEFEKGDDRDIVMAVICVLLCIDDVSTQQGAPSKEVIQQVLLEVLAIRGDEPPENQEASLQWVDLITAVTPKRFMTWYQADDHISRTVRDQSLHKRQQKAYILKTLQKLHHKRAQP